MAIQYKKFEDLLKICMEKKYSTFTMEQVGLIARTTNDGNKAVDKMISLCKDSKTEKQFLQEAQKLILNVNDKEK